MTLDETSTLIQRSLAGERMAQAIRLLREVLAMGSEARGDCKPLLAIIHGVERLADGLRDDPVSADAAVVIAQGIVEHDLLKAEVASLTRERDALIKAWPRLGLYCAWDVPGEGWAARSSVTGQAIAGFATHEAAVRFAAGLDDGAGEAEGGS